MWPIVQISRNSLGQMDKSTSLTRIDSVNWTMLNHGRKRKDQSLPDCFAAITTGRTTTYPFGSVAQSSGSTAHSYVVDGTRAVFRGDIASSEAAIGFAITMVLVVLGVRYGTRMVRRESA